MSAFFSLSDRFFAAPAGGASVLPREFFLRDLDGDGRLDALLT